MYWTNGAILSASTSPQRAATVYLVGAGPGHPDLITVRGLRLLQRADVVVYDALVHADLVAATRPDAEHVYVGKRGYCVGSTHQETINDLLVRHAQEGKAVVRLKGGDPCVFGRGGEEALYLAERGVRVEIVPGVTTAVGACAAASIPLTHREVGQAVALVTGHHDPDSPDCTLDWPALAAVGNIVVYMGLRHVERIAARLIESGLAPDTPAAVVASATLLAERVVEGELATIAALARDAGLAAPAVLVIGENVRVRSRLRFLTAEPSEGRAWASAG